jgi:hypothetical protein
MTGCGLPRPIQRCPASPGAVLVRERVGPPLWPLAARSRPNRGPGRFGPLKATEGPPGPLLGPQDEGQMNGSADILENYDIERKELLVVLRWTRRVSRCAISSQRGPSTDEILVSRQPRSVYSLYSPILATR